MPDLDLAQTLALLLQSGEVESARVEITLKPKPVQPPPSEDSPKAVISIGPVRRK